MRYVVSLMLFAASVIHLMPLTGVVGGERLAAVYGMPFDEPNIAILMRHRAVLFGLLGLYLLAAAFRKGLQPTALTAGIISVVSFIGLAMATGGYNAQIELIVIADIVALVCLVVGTIAYALNAYKQN